MSEKKNLLWRLDLLEHHFLNTKVRFVRTKALLKAKGKKKAHLLPQSKDEAIKEIEGLKLDILGRKIHSSLVKYNRAIKKAVKVMPAKTNKDELEFLKSLDIDQISTIRIVKLIQSIFKLNPKKIEDAPGFVPEWIIDIVKDKTNVKNPSHFYNSLTPEQRNWYSKLMNKKDVQAIADIIENSFKIVLGATGKDHKKDIEDIDTTDGESDDESDEGDESIGSETVKDHAELQDEDHADSNEDDDFEKYAQFDNLIAGSDEDDSDVELDNTINYNEVTDEEPSDVEEEEDEEDDFFVEDVKEKKSKKEKKEKTTKKKEKTKLPELQYGYISGSDDEDIDEDEVVKSVTQPKKNRRGQRARQKIWEQKYGRGAKHIQKEKEKVRLEREQRQREYEERVAKRAAKAAITGSNNTPLGERKDTTTGSGVEPKQDKELHPSWIAKKKQEEALKNVKFSGKKIVF